MNTKKVRGRLRVPQTVPDNLIKILVEQRRVLVAARCDDAVLIQYAALIRFLRSAAPDELRRILTEPVLPEKVTPDQPEQSDSELASLSVSDVEKVINDETTSRKYLERIAIHRFRVPRGSMRSFSNREMLVNKLSTLLRNEQAHTAIETVARGQGELPGVDTKVKR